MNRTLRLLCAVYSQRSICCVLSSMEIKLRDEDGNEDNSDVKTELGFI